MEQSGNLKLTNNHNVSTTSVGQDSCPESCPLLKVANDPLSGGCYANHGRTAITTNKLNRFAKRQKRTTAALRLMMAKQEAAGIRKLSGKRQLRGHVVGDCATSQSARIVGPAYVEHTAKQGKAHWLYTHGWPTIPLKSWAGANVLASCHTTAEIVQARSRGYATTVVVPKHPTNKIYTHDGEKVIPCPAQFKHEGVRVVTCEFCTLCKRPDFLLANKFSIGFEPDYGTEKRVMRMMEVK